jgi:ABC-2 type transport system permease protein
MSMLRVELTTQLLRARTLIALAGLAAVPVIAGLATASHAGHRDGNQGGLFGAATYSALNHTMASLDFTAPLLLPLAVALLASAVGSADRAWGTLRYLYVQPVTRSRLLAGKLAAVLVITAAATGCVLAAGFFTGLALFGWHAFHVIGAPSLPEADAVGRCLAAAGYTLLCMLSIGAITLALGLLLPHGAEALGASLALVIAGSILSAHQHNLATYLPMYYWQDWATLFEPAGTAHLGAGIAAQAAAITAAVGVSVLVLLRRDPAA